MTGSPEAVRFLELLPLEFIMASVLGLFYTLLNGGSNSPTGKCNPPGEYTPLCAVTPTNTHTNKQNGQPIFNQVWIPFHAPARVYFTVCRPPAFLFFFFPVFFLHTHRHSYTTCIGHKGWRWDTHLRENWECLLAVHSQTINHVRLH